MLNECYKDVNYKVWCPSLHTEISLVKGFNDITSIHTNCGPVLKLRLMNNYCHPL